MYLKKFNHYVDEGAATKNKPNESESEQKVKWSKKKK